MAPCLSEAQGGMTASTCGATRLQVLHVEDLSLYERKLPAAWGLTYQQLSPGRFEGSLERLPLPGMEVFRERTSRALRQHGVLGSGQVGLAVTMSGRGPLHFNWRRADAFTLLVGSGAFELCSPAGADIAGVTVDETLLMEAWRCRFPVDDAPWRTGTRGMRLSVSGLRVLRRTLRHALAWASAAPCDAGSSIDEGLQMRAWVLHRFVEVLASANADDGLDRRVDDAAEWPGGRRGVVQTCCKLVQANPQAPISIAQLSGRLGISRRTLQTCFHESVGMSPGRFLRSLRLNAVRLGLARHAAVPRSVRDVATDFGFWHWSQLSSDYRGLFGELPSTTLRRGGSTPDPRLACPRS